MSMVYTWTFIYLSIDLSTKLSVSIYLFVYRYSNILVAVHSNSNDAGYWWRYFILTVVDWQMEMIRELNICAKTSCTNNKKVSKYN